MPTLPTGTVTFLFTDIEGSTRLLESLGDAYTTVLERHHALLREAIAAGDGTEVSTEGDAFFAVFPSAPRAVGGGRRRAAGPGRRALAGRRERPGPDGPAHRRGDARRRQLRRAWTCIGPPASRQLATAARCWFPARLRPSRLGSLPPGVGFTDLGQHRLKDLSRPEHLWQLTVDGLPADFPPPRTLDATPNNLPLQLTSFLGRQREVADVLELLAANRLVTLTGPGGTGKTRLALQVAAEAADRYPDGVYFVALEPITNAALLVPTIAQSIGLSDPGSASVQRLADHLGERAFLLVLDNVEQVGDAAPQIGDVLGLAARRPSLPPAGARSASTASTSTRSRRSGLPDPRHLPDLEQFTQFESVALFVERAVAVKPGFAVDNDERAGGGRDLRPPRRSAAGHRAGRGAGSGAHPAGYPRPSQRPACAAVGWRPRPARTPADAARRHRLEPRPARRSRPAGVRAHIGLCRWCQPRADRGGVLRARRPGPGPRRGELAGGQVSAPPGVLRRHAALSYARDHPPVR